MANENFVVRHGLIVCGDVGIDTHLGVSGNTSVGGGLTVTGATDLAGSLDVSGGASFGAGLTVTGTLSAEDIDVSGNVTTSTLTVTGATDLNGTLGVCGNTSLAGILKVDNNTDLNGTLDVSGNTSLAGILTVTGATDLNSTLGVCGNTSLGGTLVVTNATDINSTLDVSGNTSVGGGLTVTGATDLAGSLEVSGGASFGGGLTVTGTLSAEDIDVSGNVTTSTLTVTNTLSAEDIDVSGSLGVCGNTSLAGILKVDNNTDLNGTLDVSGNTSVGGGLTVTGATDLNGTLGVCGNTSLAGILKVDNNTDLNGTLDVSGNTSVGGGLTVTGATDLNGTLGVCGNTSLAGTLTVCGNTTTSTLTVGNTLSAEDIDVSGSLSVSGNISAGSATITGTLSAEDIDVSGNVTTSTLTVLKSATISTLTVSGNTTTSTLTVCASATISGDTQIKTRLTVGSGHIGSRNPGFSVIGDADSSPLVVKTSGKATVFSVFPWDTGITYIASGIYYDDGAWVHSSTDTTNCLFSIGGSQGANWYSSSNSTGSWNVASNVSLWNSTAQWDNQLSTNVTYNGNTIWHAGNDGSGSGLDADTVDGQQRDNLGATLATYGTTGGASGRVRCTAPFNTNSSKMFQITISLYGSYTMETYVVGAYMYSSTNQWYSPTCIYTGGGNNSPDIKVGRDSNGKAYISIANRNYMGVRVHNMTRGYTTSVGDTYDPWTITINAGTENSVTPTVYENWHSGNDGSGSGLDADLLDGLQLHTGRNNEANKVVRTDANGYIQAGWINSISGTHSSAVTKVYSTYSGDSYIRYCTPDHLANSMSNVLHSNAADTASQRIGFQANATNNWDTIATGTGSLGCIEIYNSGSGNDAFMSFHVGGDYACYFGLDGGTNKLSVGGWSMGANSYEIYHSGNKPSLATLGFTGASNANYITNNNQLTNGAGYYSSGSSPTFSDAYNNGWWRNNNASEGLYNQSTQQHFYSASSTYWHLNSTNGVVFYTAYNASAGNATGRQGYLYWSGAGFGLLGAAGAWAVCIRSSGTDVIFGGPTTNNHYNSTSSARVSFGGGNDMSNYHLGTNSENYGGTYTKLDLRWHTGIRMGAQSTYGGIRFFDTEDLGSVHFHIAGSSNYIHKYVWMYTNANGFYSDTNGAHFYPNTAFSYGTWRVNGSKTGYTGIVYDDGGDVVSGMFDSGGNGGDYNTSSGWHYYYHRGNTCLGVSGSSTSISYGLYVTGGIYSSSGNIYAASDARVKKDIKTIENALDKVLNLRGVTYIKTNKTENDPNNGKTEMGVIAQEVLEVVPEVVNHAEDIDVYAVDYGNFAGLFIEAIKEQNEVINNLRQEVLNLKNQLGM